MLVPASFGNASAPPRIEQIRADSLVAHRPVLLVETSLSRSLYVVRSPVVPNPVIATALSDRTCAGCRRPSGNFRFPPTSQVVTQSASECFLLHRDVIHARVRWAAAISRFTSSRSFGRHQVGNGLSGPPLHGGYGELRARLPQRGKRRLQRRSRRSRKHGDRVAVGGDHQVLLLGKRSPHVRRPATQLTNTHELYQLALLYAFVYPFRMRLRRLSASAASV